jgi:hypothetical protein
MQSIEEQYGNTLTLLRDGGVPLTVIQETTKGIPTLEGKLNALESLQIENGIDPWTQYSALVEMTITSGKLTGVEIKDAVGDCNDPAKKLAALRKRLNIKENKPGKIKRENGGRADLFESARPSNDERVQKYMVMHKCSFREASILAGLPDPGSHVKDSGDEIGKLAGRWKKYCPTLKESEIQTLAKRGMEPR